MNADINALINPRNYLTSSSLVPYTTQVDGNSWYVLKTDFNSFGDARYYLNTNPSGFITSSALVGYYTQSDANSVFYKRTDFNYLSFVSSSALVSYELKADLNSDINALINPRGYLTSYTDTNWQTNFTAFDTNMKNQFRAYSVDLNTSTNVNGSIVHASSNVVADVNVNVGSYINIGANGYIYDDGNTIIIGRR